MPCHDTNSFSGLKRCGDGARSRLEDRHRGRIVRSDRQKSAVRAETNDMGIFRHKDASLFSVRQVQDFHLAGAVGGNQLVVIRAVVDAPTSHQGRVRTTPGDDHTPQLKIPNAQRTVLIPRREQLAIVAETQNPPEFPLGGWKLGAVSASSCLRQMLMPPSGKLNA